MRVSRTLVFLAWALELSAEDDAGLIVRWRWPVGTVGLYSTPNGRSLYLLRTLEARAVDKAPRAHLEAARRFTTFTQQDPAEWFAFKVPKGSEVLHKWGYAVELLYRSDKWNREPTDYVHKFTGAPVAYADRKPGPRAKPSAWGILGTDGRTLVTARGIVG